MFTHCVLNNLNYSKYIIMKTGKSIGLIYVLFFLSSFNFYGQTKKQQPEYSKGGYYELPNSGRAVLDFNVGWKYHKGSVANANNRGYDDASWEIVNTPHGLELNPLIASGSNNYQGEAWYRKHFTIPDSLTEKRLVIHFESVMGKSKVWLNGKLLTTHYGGYLPFSVDITDEIEENNVIAVWTDNSDDPNYPPGKQQKVLDFSYFGGIYRDVWLIATNNVFITNSNASTKVAGGGVFVHYENLSKESVDVKIQTEIKNIDSSSKTLKVHYVLKDENDKQVSEQFSTIKIPKNASKQNKVSIKLKDPLLWSPKRPYQYGLEISILDTSEGIIDGVKLKLGIRKIEFRGREGFFLNNEPYEGKLMGANRHQDFAYIGNALPNSGQWRDAIILKNAGCEIIRGAHYPADPAFMDACDALGIFVIVATPGWQFWNDTNPQFEKLIYNDIRQMVRRDRNHPSVILWEPILNETEYPDYFAEKTHNLVHEEYPFQGAFTACDARNHEGSEFFDLVYSHPRFDRKIPKSEFNSKEKKIQPSQFDYSTEHRSIFTREWGDNVDDWNSHNSTSRVARGWGESAQLIQANHYANTKHRLTNWETIYSTPRQHVGGALWHSFDHQRGYHPDPFYGGIADAFRQPKYSYYLFEAQQKASESKPMAYIAHEMSPFSSKDVSVFTNCDEVRLIVMGKDTLSIKKNKDAFNMPNPIMVFEDVFDFMDLKKLYRSKRHKEATIVAEGIIDGKVVVSSTKRPTNRRTKIKLELADNDIALVANGSDIITVIASIVDDNGNVKRLCNDYIKFEIEGEGEIVGDASIMANPRKVDWGTAPVLIRSTTNAGNIKIKASVLKEGIHTPISAVLSFESIEPDISLLFEDIPALISSSEPEVLAKTKISNNRVGILESKILKLEKELNRYKLKEVEKQQQIFEGND